MKRVITILLGVLLVVSPTIAMVGMYFYLQSSDSTIVNTELVSGEFVFPTGEVLNCDNNEYEVMAVFAGLHGTEEENKPVKVSDPPTEIASATVYEATYKDNFDKDYHYKYYMTEDAENCYFSDKSNTFYKIAKASAEVFLNSAYSENVYAMSVAPTVTLGGTLLTPYTLDWNYKTVGGTLKGATCSYEDKDEKTNVASFVSNFTPVFSLTPDKISVVVKNTNNNTVVYEGNLSGMQALSLEGSLETTVDMTVVWNNSNDKTYAGSAKYFFNGRMFGKAIFSLSTDHATCGDVVILTANNVSSPNEIEIESTPALNYTPDFYQVGDTWQALIPLAHDLVSEKTDFLLTVTSTASSATDVMSLRVEPLTAGEFKSYSRKSWLNLYSENTLKSFKDTVLPVATSHSSFSFEGGTFVMPTKENYVSAGKSLVYSYGTNITINDVPGASYLALEQAYWANCGPKQESGEYAPGVKTEVLAAFDGKVVFVGSLSLTGRIVAIDHGSGLITWYTNLTSTSEKPIEVKVGDRVTAGQRIAYAADAGINEDDFNFHFRVAATVNGVPVNLQSLIEKGVGAVSDAD